MIDETNIIPFSKQDVKAVCDALGTNLQADNLTTRTEAGEGTLVPTHFSEENITASLKNEKTIDELGASNTRSGSKIIVIIPVKC